MKEGQDINHKVKKCQAICGSIRTRPNGKTRQDTQLRFYFAVALPVLMYGSEGWTVTSKKIRFLRSVEGCARQGHLRNELGIEPETQKIIKYRENGKHIERMAEEGIRKEIPEN